jgi:hypothetical protein
MKKFEFLEFVLLVEFEKCLLKYEKKQEKFIKSNFFSD